MTQQSLRARSIAEFRDIFQDLLENGKICSPRGQKVLEIEDYSYKLSPRVRFCNFKVRKLNLEYIKEEFLWYLRGDRFDQSITEYAKMWKGLIDVDGGINSNYGQYIFKSFYSCGDETSCFSYVVDELSKDKDSRRASIPILHRGHLVVGTKDLPCTYSLNFRIRDDQLNMSVHMRSQDAIFGMGNDAPCFSLIQEMVWAALLDKYPKLKLGTYHHIADSFHVYERHFEMLEQLAQAKSSDYVEVQCPKISGPREVEFLRRYAHYKNTDDIKLGHHQIFVEHPLLLEGLKLQVKDYKFSSWLHSRKATSK